MKFLHAKIQLTNFAVFYDLLVSSLH